MKASWMAWGTAAAILSGCPAPTALMAPMYVFQGMPYTQRSSATEAYRSFFRDLIDQIEPLPEAVAGPVKIILPDKGAVLKSGLVDRGDARVRDYGADLVTESYRMIADCIVRRHIFAHVELVSTIDPVHANPEPGVAIIYFYLSPENPRDLGWYFVSERHSRTRLFAASGLKTQEDKNQSFVRNVEDVARKYWSL